MRIIRTFHPIGQGAFYSERFYEAQKAFNVVYDCGVKNVSNRHKRIVRQAFTEEDVINYLFISHLDDDHISLVTTLWDSVRNVRNVVLPYISPENVVIHKILSKSLGLVEIFDFWSRVHSILNGNSDTDTNIMFVYSDEEGAEQYINKSRNFLSSGAHLTICSDWVFIPYNRHIKRKKELEDNLNDLIQNVDFQKALGQIGVTIDTVEDLKNKITKAEFADLLSSQAIREYLKGAYKYITGTINQNSLLVYSGPSTDNSSYRMDRHAICPFEIKAYHELRLCRYCLSSPFFRKRVACLYTGDSDFDMNRYEQELQKLWNNVSTIQLPHHGSYASFQFDKNKNEFDKGYVFPVSCGETNPYGHPSAKVLDFLMANDCIPFVVTENAGTRYSQVIKG